MKKKTSLKRSRFPYILGTSLLVLTIGASLLGFFAYSNLNDIIGTLEDEAKPHVNLLLFNDIKLELQEIDHSMERYVYTSQQSHMSKFRNSIESAIQILDTLKNKNVDQEILNSVDSLRNLILTKGTILTQVGNLDYESMEATFANLKDQLNDIQTKQVLEDTVMRKKRGFLQRLFGKKEPQVISDTLDIYGSAEYKELVNSQLDSIARRSQQKAYTQKLKELTLQQDHQDIQKAISALISTMEKWELRKIREQSADASGIAKYTSKYVTMFSVVVPVLLLITLTVLIIYIIRTKKHQEILQSGRKNALRLAKEKEQFLANMSHEIRTPMNAINGFAKILLKGDLNKEQYDYVRIIGQSTDHLTHILNDVLDFSKLQSGKIKLEQKPFKLVELVKDTAKLLADKAEEKGIKIKCNTNELPKVVIGDPYRLRQILLNLISNSIKFTDRGEVTIKAAVGKKAKNGIVIVIFEIIDTGIGIPLNRQKTIFDEFEQVNRDDKREGTGLGLSITKKLVTIHRGKIKLESVEGEGTKFTVSIPYGTADATMVPSKDLAQEIKLKNMHILIADDESFNRKLLEAIFMEHEITYDFAEHGEEAFELMSKTQYDVVLMDFRMPHLNGPEVAEKIRNIGKLNVDTPIVGLTATVSDQDMKMAKNSGIDHVLRKPFDTQELLEIIKEYQATIASKEVDKNQDYNRDNMYDLSALSKMGDEDFVRDMIETFISSTTENLKELEQHYQNEDWRNIGEVLHKIIAPARHLKANDLVTQLKKNEISAREGNPISLDEYETIKSSTLKLVNSLQLDLQKN
ncbi:ATP-binding protein [Ekhidna sp.]|uniref:hybrid sensor histidine kinase/response regulator n=2 Tax=Ekhidna sp. TaxID=2608089 RepID=UPI0032970F74